MIDFERVYIDTSPLIYYLEHSSLYMDKIKEFFAMCLESHIQIFFNHFCTAIELSEINLTFLV